MPMNMPVMATTGTLRTPTVYSAGNRVRAYGRARAIQATVWAANRLTSPSPARVAYTAPPSADSPPAASRSAVAIGMHSWENPSLALRALISHRQPARVGQTEKRRGAGELIRARRPLRLFRALRGGAGPYNDCRRDGRRQRAGFPEPAVPCGSSMRVEAWAGVPTGVA